MENKKTVLVTGATSGIGWHTALYLSKEGYRIIACGRRKERLEELASILENDIHTLVFDVRNREDLEKQIQGLPEEWRDIDVLVNNAGNAHGLNPIQHGDIEDWDAMIDINVKGLLYVSKAIIPAMIQKGGGHIVNVGSIAGKEVYKNGNVYCASKFAVDAINQGMRMDLNEHGIRVSAVNPGLVETEFSMVRFKGDEERSKKVYEGFEALNGEDIARIIHFIISSPAHVMISDLTVFPTAQASATILNRD